MQAMTVIIMSNIGYFQIKLRIAHAMILCTGGAIIVFVIILSVNFMSEKISVGFSK